MKQKKVTQQQLAELIEDAIFHSSENTGLMLAIDISTRLNDELDSYWKDLHGVVHGDSIAPPIQDSDIKE